MIRSTFRRSVMKEVSLKAAAFMWLISSAHGRIISSDYHFNAEEANDEEINKISDDQNQELNHNPDIKVETRDPRLSELEWSTYSVREPNGPGTFAFGYDNIVDSAGNEHFRNEERFENGTVIGDYGYTDNRIKRIVRVTYTADHRGYRAKTEFLPLEDSSENTRSD